MAATLELRLTGGASNSDPDLSLGGVQSSAVVSSTAMNNLFDNVSPDEASAGDTEYRAVAVRNTGDAAATLVEIYMSTETSSPSSQIDLGSEGVDPGSPISLADESDSTNQLSGITFTHNTSASKLSLSDIPAGSECRIWLERTISASAGNTSNDEGTITVDYA